MFNGQRAAETLQIKNVFLNDELTTIPIGNGSFLLKYYSQARAGELFFSLDYLADERGMRGLLSELDDIRVLSCWRNIFIFSRFHRQNRKKYDGEIEFYLRPPADWFVSFLDKSKWAYKVVNNQWISSQTTRLRHFYLNMSDHHEYVVSMNIPHLATANDSNFECYFLIRSGEYSDSSFSCSEHKRTFIFADRKLAYFHSIYCRWGESWRE